MKKIFENSLYISLTLCLIGQIVIGGNYLLGQGIYLIANSINIIRTFALRRPTSDKVKDVCFLGVTIGLIIYNVVTR